MIIVGVPAINGLGHTQGCEQAPEVILEGIEHKTISLDNDNVEEQQSAIFGKAKQFLKQGAIFVGGDHSISYPIVRAFIESNRNKKCLIVFDAHPDTMPPMKEPTHEEWLRAAIESGISGKNVVLIGARMVEPEEKEFLQKKGVSCIGVNDARDIDETLRKIKGVAYGKDVYVSVDLDVLDPKEFDSTGYVAKNGLNFETLGVLLDEILAGGIVAADMVEYNPKIGDKDKGLAIARTILNKFISAFEK